MATDEPSPSPIPDSRRLLDDRLQEVELRLAYEDVEARNHIVDALASLREQRKCSQAELARRSGTTQSAVSEFETHQTEPRLATLQRHARALGARIGIQLWDGPFLHYNSWLHRIAPYDRAIRNVRVVEDAIARSWLEPSASPPTSRLPAAKNMQSSSAYIGWLRTDIEPLRVVPVPTEIKADAARLLQKQLADPEFRAAYEDTVARSRLVTFFGDLRKRNGLSQANLARMMRVSQSAISDFEKGVAEPRVAMLQRYARAFGMRLELQLWNGPFVLFNSWIRRFLPYDDVMAAVRVDDERASSWLRDFGLPAISDAEGRGVGNSPTGQTNPTGRVEISKQQVEVSEISTRDEPNQDPYFREIALAGERR